MKASTMDLVAKYDTIQREFTERRGAFDVDAVKDASRWFHFEPHPGVGVWPVPYTKLNLPNDCTRLVVLMLEDAPAVAAAGGGVREGGDASDGRRRRRVLQRTTERLSRHGVLPLAAHGPGGGSNDKGNEFILIRVRAIGLTGKCFLTGWKIDA